MVMNDTYPKQTNHEEDQAPKAEAIRLGIDLQQWNERIEELIGQGARIIAFRGAGTVNGIETGAANNATNLLHEYIEQITADGTPVALIFDGDGDNREKPDVGSIFGGLADSFSENSHVTTIAAQTEGWYSPATENGAIETTTGEPYETYVFPDDLPGSHASVTQSKALVSYPNYEQVFVGPAGPIAFSQLEDLNSKTGDRPEDAGPVKVTILQTPNNPDLKSQFDMQLSAAAEDEQRKAKIQAKISQRQEQPYGALFTKDGVFSVDINKYPHIRFSITSVS